MNFSAEHKDIVFHLSTRDFVPDKKYTLLFKSSQTIKWCCHLEFAFIIEWGKILGIRKRGKIQG